MSDSHREVPHGPSALRAENVVITGGTWNSVAGNLYHGPRGTILVYPYRSLTSFKAANCDHSIL